MYGYYIPISHTATPVREEFVAEEERLGVAEA